MKLACMKHTNSPLVKAKIGIVRGSYMKQRGYAVVIKHE